MWLLCNLSLTAKVVDSILRLLSPFITGGLIAFVLNVPMVFLEKKLFANFAPFGLPSRKVKRPVALAVTLLAFGAILAVILFWILPGIARSLSALTTQLPEMINAVEKQIQQLLNQYPQAAQWLQDWNLEIDIEGFVEDLY